MAFSPFSTSSISDPNFSAPLVGQSQGVAGLPTGGVALDRLQMCGCQQQPEAAGAPGALLQSQQGLQTQLLTQMLGLLITLLQNRASGQQGSANGGSVSGVGGSGGTGGAQASDGQTQGGQGPTPKGDGSTVQRQGKPIGAHIAKQFDDMVAAAKQDGINLTISSGARSRAEQERLYAAYKNGTGNLAAKPGTSNHESGDALDLGPPSAYGWLKQNAGRFGFKNSIPSEPWHWSLTGK